MLRIYIVEFCCEIQYLGSLIYRPKMVEKVQFWSRPHSTPKLVFTYMFYLYIIFYICKIQRGGRMRPWPNFDFYRVKYTFLNWINSNDFCKNTLLPDIVSAYSLKFYCKYTIDSALIDMLSNVDNTFLETSSL